MFSTTSVVWSVNVLVALDVIIASVFIWWVLNYDNLYNK